MKVKFLTVSAVSIAAITCAGCGLFDSGDLWQDGKYVLYWIDTHENMSLGLDLNGNSYLDRVEPTVFAVGSNERYVVAKQHPSGNRAVTNYYIIDKATDNKNFNDDEATKRPLTAEQFQSLKTIRGLPEFQKTVTSLE